MSNYITIKLRRGTAAQWAATNPVLAEGEVGLETDTRKFKVGTGAAAWNSLQYWGGSGGGGATDFTDLGDVPASYFGQAGKFVKVNATADGLEFGTLTIAAGDLPSGIDAAKIADGTVSNTEFQYLDGVTSPIQTQLNGKANTVHTHVVGDITNISGQHLLGRHASGTGTGQEIGVDGGLEIHGSTIRRSALTGDVTATAGDNVMTIANNAVTNAKVGTGIDAAKLADGSVSNTEFQTLNGVTSAIQTQIDGKAATVHTHAIGDVTGLQTALDSKVDENAAIAGATKTKITYDAKGLVTAGADATTADIADSNDKRYVTEAEKTKLSNLSGTNTGDQNLFSTIAVSGQSNVVADGTGDTLTLVAGSNITITTDAGTDSITISSTGGGGGGISDGDKGDITVSASGTVWTIDNSAVTLAKMADVATSSVFYRKTAGTGAPEVQTLSTLKTDLGLTGTNSGDQTITLTGDVTGSGTGSFAATIANKAVTLAKIQDITTSRILGRVTAGTGVTEELTGTQVTAILDTFTDSLKGVAPASGGGTTNFLRADGTWAAPAGGGGGISDGDKGDITVSASGATWTIDNDAVTYAKMQNVSAASRVLGRKTSGAGDTEELTASEVLDFIGSTRGSVLYAGASGWAALTPGTSGQVLQTNGAGADPSWATASGGGGGGGATNLWIAASQMIPRSTNGAGIDSRELATNRTNYDELLFDAGADEFAQFLVIMPNNYANGTVTARFYWTASTGSGDVVWGLQGRAFADDDALDTAFGTAQTVTDTLIATNDMHVTSATSAITIGGTPAANRPILFQVYRDADAGTDTFTADARLLGVEILF